MNDTKYVYSFGGGTADGRTDMKNLLGGKGANLAEMATMGIPVFGDAIEAAYVARAIGDIRTLQTEITRYEVQFHRLPDTLQEVGVTDLLDPWINPSLAAALLDPEHELPSQPAPAIDDAAGSEGGEG